MPPSDLVIRGQQVVLADESAHSGIRQRVAPASIHIFGGRIESIKTFDDTGAAREVVTAANESIVMPGLVDTHVHINEPGRTDWEGFATATAAAAAGGVTTLIDMPLNSIPPTTTLFGLKEKVQAAADQCSVDVGFWGGVVPGNTAELEKLNEAGVVGFKCFLVPSGVDEFPNVTEADLRVAMPELARLGALLIVHAELPGPIDSADISNNRPADYQTFLSSRPRKAEDEAVALMIKLSQEFAARVHIVHHSSADTLPTLRQAKSGGVKISAETCPHYLYFAAEDIPEGATEFKCCPPIREAENREKLWQAVADGTIDMIVSDHSPCPPAMKLKETGNFLSAWGGISSLEFRLPVIWTSARRRGFDVTDLTEWLCAAPARLVQLNRTKGAIAPGHDADIVIWNSDAEYPIDANSIHHRHKLTPYAGRIFQGVTEKTFLRGQKIYDDGQLIAKQTGRLLKVQN